MTVVQGVFESLCFFVCVLFFSHISFCAKLSKQTLFVFIFLRKSFCGLYNLVKNGEYGKALPQLQTLPQDGWSSNMIGVCYQMTGNSGKAWEYFNKAASMGDSEAAKNLKQLKRP